MVKNIVINDNHSVEVNTSAGWLLIYRSQFGHDILPDLMPALETALEFITGMLQELGEDAKELSEITYDKLLKCFASDTMSDALFKLSTLEITTVIQIFWAMAKNSNRDIKPPEEWINEFDTFPLDIIIKELFEVMMTSFISSKNLKRLKELKPQVKVSELRTSSLLAPLGA